MIKVYCRTNLDEGKKYQWPTVFAMAPTLGERVQCIMGSGKYPEYRLKIVGITHTVFKDYVGHGDHVDQRGRYEWTPIVEVELNT